MHAASLLRAPFARTFAVSLLLTGVTGVLSHSALAQPALPDESAKGEALSPEAAPAKKGAYLSDWYNQDLTLIGSKDISFGPQPADDIYLEYEYFGRKGPFELYGYIDIPKIFNIGNSHDKGVWDHGSPVFMEHEPRISIDYLAGRSLAIGPFKEWYVAFDWIYDHGSRKRTAPTPCTAASAPTSTPIRGSTCRPTCTVATSGKTTARAMNIRGTATARSSSTSCPSTNSAMARR